ncbi:PAS domain-containing protein [Sphingomonas melonis]
MNMDKHQSALARAVLSSATDFAIITTNLAGEVTSWNPGAENLLGWSEAEMLGEHAERFFTPEDNAANRCETEMTLAREKGRAEDERWHMKKDGSRLWASGLMMRFEDEHTDEHIGYLKILRDRTAQHEAEQATKENERRYRQLFEERARAQADLQLALDAGNLGTFSFSLPDHELVSSDRFKANFGRDPNLPFTYAEKMAAVHPEDLADVERAVERSIATGEGYDLAFRIRWPDDTEHWVHTRARVMRDGGDEPIGMTGVAANVTAEKMQEAALNKLTLDLEHAVDRRTAELLGKNEELLAQIAVREQAEDALRQAQKMEAVGQLTGGVAHDFNNLLTIIKSSIELLSRPNLREDRRQRYMDAISETADRAAKLTGQLLAFARRQPLKAEHFDVDAQLLASLPILRTTTGSRIEVVSSGIVAGGEVEVDRNQFDTAILNMVVNARDAMPEGGRIEISTGTADKVPAVRAHAETPGNYVTVTIADTGSGMDEGTAIRIFEPFFTTKEVGRGTGLGLSQVFGFAKQSGGEVIVESVPDEGTRFIMYLPVAQSPMPAVSATAPEPAREGNGHGCVLVVEDNQLVGEFATQLLEDVGYGTVWAPHAQAALDLVNEKPDRFHVVFTDVVMPGMSGIELAQELRRSHPALPVVLTSGYSSVLAQEGTHGFPLIQKPYNASNVAEVLNKMKRG